MPGYVARCPGAGRPPRRRPYDPPSGTSEASIWPPKLGSATPWSTVSCRLPRARRVAGPRRATHVQVLLAQGAANTVWRPSCRPAPSWAVTVTAGPVSEHFLTAGVWSVRARSRRSFIGQRRVPGRERRSFWGLAERRPSSPLRPGRFSCTPDSRPADQMTGPHGRGGGQSS